MASAFLDLEEAALQWKGRRNLFSIQLPLSIKFLLLLLMVFLQEAK